MDALTRVLVLSIGGALGVNARYWLSLGMARWASPRFPWSTFVINVTGSFAIGILAVVLSHRWPHPLGRLFVVVGFLGGYTTFSSFAFESYTLWEGGEKGLALANTVGSVVAGLAAVVIGVAVARSFVGPLDKPDGVVLPPGVSGDVEAGKP